jgi:carboxyl-terminal processing protease
LEAALNGSGVITAFATQYLSSHKLAPGPFEVSPDLIDEFKVYASGRQIQPNISEWSQERSWISSRLKEEIVTQAQGVEKGDEIQAKTDSQIQAALRAIQESAQPAPAVAYFDRR